MKAAQIKQYSKNIDIKVHEVPIPKMGNHDALIRVKAAAVNPVDILNLTGAVRLIQDYQMPLTLGNVCTEGRWNSSQSAHCTEQVVCEKKVFHKCCQKREYISAV